MVYIPISPIFKESMRTTILYGYRGSHAHGTYIAPDNPMSTDDVDYMGVDIADLDCYFGLKHFEQQEIKEGADDIIIYELRKFVRLLIKQNPNVISFLWNKPDMFLTVHPAGQVLLESKELFSSKFIYYTFMGYAKSQYNKMFGSAYSGYMGAKRKAVFDQFGYDTKNASHLLRLLTMCDEFLRTGEMIVYRPDAQKYIDIKQGLWTKDQIEKEVQAMYVKVEDSYKASTLREQVDEQAVNSLLMSIMKDFFNG